MDRVLKAGDNQVEPVAALEEHLTLARAHEGAMWFRPGVELCRKSCKRNFAVMT